jgi:hypothetical protein
VLQERGARKSWEIGDAALFGPEEIGQRPLFPLFPRKLHTPAWNCARHGLNKADDFVAVHEEKNAEKKKREETRRNDEEKVKKREKALYFSLRLQRRKTAKLRT